MLAHNISFCSGIILLLVVRGPLDLSGARPPLLIHTTFDCEDTFLSKRMFAAPIRFHWSDADYVG
jgi:hypothetical protein